MHMFQGGIPTPLVKTRKKSIKNPHIHNGGYVVRKRMANPGALGGISAQAERDKPALIAGRSGTVRQNDRLRQYALQDAAPYPPFFGISATGIRPNALRNPPKRLHAQGL